MEGEYSIELFREGGEGAGIENVLAARLSSFSGQFNAT
jgi:hypothetical protein